MNTTTTPLYRILQTASPELSTDRTEVFFIMDNIADWQTLAAGGDLSGIIDAFAGSTESTQLYGEIDAAKKFTWILDQDQDGLGQFLATYDANDEFTARQWLAQVASEAPTLTDVYDVLAADIANAGDLILIGVSASVSDIV